MPVRNKVALFGTGMIRSMLYAGAATLSFAEIKQEKSAFDSDMLVKILEPIDYTLLVKEYKKVQRKYYPEKDLLIKKEKGEI